MNLDKMMERTTKMITVKSRGYVMTSRGMIMSPIRTPYREQVDRIWSMITKDRAEVYERLKDGTDLKLDVQNYDKDNQPKKRVTPKKVETAPDLPATKPQESVQNQNNQQNNNSQNIYQQNNQPGNGKKNKKKNKQNNWDNNQNQQNNNQQAANPADAPETDPAIEDTANTESNETVETVGEVKVDTNEQSVIQEIKVEDQKEFTPIQETKVEDQKELTPEEKREESAALAVTVETA